MVDRERLKGFLLHEDPAVREFVAEYFAQSWAPDPDLILRVLEACRKYGDEDNKIALYHASRFALTGESFAAVLAHLKDASDVNVVQALNTIITQAPADVLERHAAAVAGAAKVAPGTKDRIDRRRRLAALSDEELWNELQNLSARSRNIRAADRVDLALADDLVDALAQHNLPTDEILCSFLRNPDFAGEWMEIFLIDLAGARRVRDAVPPLVEKFRVDTDFMLGRASEALARIGDPEAARLIACTFTGESWMFRLYTSGLLGHIKHGAAEQAILGILPGEPEPVIRVNLIEGLCTLLSDRAIPIAREAIERGYARHILSLEDTLLNVACILDISLPEEEKWRAERDRRRSQLAAHLPDMAEAARMFQDMIAQGADPFAPIGKSAKPDREPTLPTASALSDQPARRKVGRNDPCPCGSGRKYKKCCGPWSG